MRKRWELAVTVAESPQLRARVMHSIAEADDRKPPQC